MTKRVVFTEEADDDVREPVNKKYMKKLETVVKKELKPLVNH